MVRAFRQGFVGPGLATWLQPSWRTFDCQRSILLCEYMLLPISEGQSLVDFSTLAVDRNLFSSRGTFCKSIFRRGIARRFWT